MTTISFDKAYTWINRFSSKKTYLSLSVQKLFSVLDNKWRNGEYQELLIIIKTIDMVCEQRGDSMEIAEANLQIARVLYQLDGNMDLVPRSEIILRFKVAANNYRYGANKHNFAISQWLLGWIFFKDEQHVEAQVAWERSIEAFEWIADRPDLEEIGTWYLEQLSAMKETLNSQIT